MAAPLRLALTGSTMGWVTQVQSNYGVQPATIARSFNGTLDRTLDSPTAPMETLGYYWHYPHLSDDNRGLGGGIAWAFDDELCIKNDAYGPKKKFEDTFREDFFFASFVTCTDIRASLHRALKTWTDVQPQLRFVDVTEDCGVYSNCSLVELFFTHRDNNGVIRGKNSYMGGPEDSPKEKRPIVKHPRPWPNGKTGSGASTYDGPLDIEGSPYPGGSVVKGVAERPDSRSDGQSDCSVVGTIPVGGWDYPKQCAGVDEKWSAGRDDLQGTAAYDVAKDAANNKASTDSAYTVGRRNRQLMEAEVILEWESMAGVAAASALQYGRYASDLRSTNGLIQRWSDGTPRRVIEAFGGIISFNVENCWYLDTAFCGPLHQLKARMGTNGAAAMIKGIAFGIFALALLVFFLLIVRVIKHQHCCDTEGKERTFKQKARGSAEEMSNFGVLPTLVLATCLWVPIALQQTIVAPCWECYDFEAAAVHEVRDPFAPSAPPSPPTPSPPTPTPTLSRPTPPPPTLTHIACEVPCVLMTDWPRPRAEPPGRDPSLGERSRDGNLPSRLLSHRLQRLQHLHRVERWHEALRFEGFPLGPLHEPLGARGRRRVGPGD